MTGHIAWSTLARPRENPLSTKIETALARLEPHRNVLEEVWSTGGRLDFWVGWFLNEDTGDALDWPILEKMGQLRIELQLNIYAPDVSSFTKLEWAVLRAIGEQISSDPEAVASGDARALQLQLSSATGRERRNTGAGFFTELEAAPSGELIKARTLGNVWATISGFQDPTTFVLFMRDGFLSCLEGSAIRDSTVDTDFSAVLFDIVPHPNTSSP